MARNCYYCGYYKEEKRKDGTIRCYCDDLDVTVDPYNPECSDEYYES